MFRHDGHLVPVDLGDDLADLLTPGIVGHQNVLLVHARQGDEGVLVQQARLLEELPLGAVAVVGADSREQVAELAAHGPIRVDEGNGGAGVQQHLRQIEGDTAAAHEGDVFGLTLCKARGLQELPELGPVGGEADAVPGPEDEIAPGDDDLVFPLHHADQEGGLEMIAEVHELLAHQGRVLPQPQLHHFKAPPGEGLHLGGRGELQQMVELLGRQQLGVDGHGQVQLFPQEAHGLFAVLGIADAGNGVGRPQALRQVAHQQIQLVRARAADEEVGLGDAGLLEGLAVRAVALHAHDVVLVGQLVQDLPAAVHNDQIMAFRHKGADQGHADLAAAHKNDSHKRLSPNA